MGQGTVAERGNHGAQLQLECAFKRRYSKLPYWACRAAARALRAPSCCLLAVCSVQHGTPQPRSLSRARSRSTTCSGVRAYWHRRWQPLVRDLARKAAIYARVDCWSREPARTIYRCVGLSMTSSMFNVSCGVWIGRLEAMDVGSVYCECR